LRLSRRPTVALRLLGRSTIALRLTVTLRSVVVGERVPVSEEIAGASVLVNDFLALVDDDGLRVRRRGRDDERGDKDGLERHCWALNER